MVITCKDNYETISVDVVPQIERMVGFWTNREISAYGWHTAECNLCGCVIQDGFSTEVNFCPSCGAKMIWR